MTPKPSRFVWAMVRRNLRAGSRHYGPIVVAIALGVGAVVAISAAADTARRAIAREAKSLLGADVELRSTRPLSPDAAAAVARLEDRGARVMGVSELVAMAVQSGRSVLVELKAVESTYPFYGVVHTEPAGSIQSLLADRGAFGAVVQEALLIRLGLELGDRFRIGDAEFVASAILRAAPDHAVGAFNLGPRVLISREALEHTALIRPGSRVRYRTLIALPSGGESAEIVGEALREELAREPVRITAFSDGQPQLRRSIDRLKIYLGLVGLTALLLGGVGVAGSARALVGERWQTLALLKCLGADSRTIFGATLGELAVLGAVGGLLGAVLGAVGQRALAAAGRTFAAIPLDAAVSPWPYVQGLAIGVVAGVGFSLWPLASAARAPASAVLRHEAAPLRPRARMVAGAAALGAVGASALVWWQVGSLGAATLFVGGLAAAGLVLAAGGWGLGRAARALPPPGSFAWSRGLRAIARPGPYSTAAIVSIGLGVTTILGIAFVERTIRAELLDQIPREAPNLFFIDIQPDQRGRFESLAAEQQIALDLVPVARSRLVEINGSPVGSEGPPGSDPEYRWYFTREYVVTAGAALPRGNEVVAGRWWDSSSPQSEAGAWVSVEQEAARRLGVDVGSTLVFDVHGVPLEARVASLRTVDWDTHNLNFYMIFSPGSLEGVPMTFLGAAQTSRAQEVALQQAVVTALPNVTAIPIGDVLASAEQVVRRVAAAARSVAVLVAAVGFVVLGGSLAASRDVRLREAMLFKTLGATRGALARALTVEFGLIGCAAGLLGILLATALAWAVARWLIDLPFVWAPGYAAAAAGLTTLGTIGVGLASTYRLLGQRPFVVLRGE